VGRKLLLTISQHCDVNAQKIVVIEYAFQRTQAAPVNEVTNEERNRLHLPVSAGGDGVYSYLDNPLVRLRRSPSSASLPTIHHPGGGTGAVVSWLPSTGANEFIGLAHELVHVEHYVCGTCYRAPTGHTFAGGDSGALEEEIRTVGLNAYAKESPSENAIRQEHSLPLRQDYSGVDLTNIVVTRPCIVVWPPR
jgi:hypothetical protein